MRNRQPRPVAPVLIGLIIIYIGAVAPMVVATLIH